MDIADKIIDAINDSSLSVKQLAEEAGVSRQSIYNVLSGAASPTVSWVSKIADALGLELDLVSTEG